MSIENLKSFKQTKFENSKVDVSKYEEVQSLRHNIEKDLGPVDILINNAGLLANVSLMEGKAEDIQRIINVNLTSQFWVKLNIHNENVHQ